jgi:hypothetical protein
VSSGPTGKAGFVLLPLTSRRPRNQHKRGALESFAAVSEETLSSPEIDETTVCAEAKDRLKNILMAAVDLLQLHYPA